MKIRRVRVQNFRSIWNLELPPESEKEFGNLTIFIGRNNSGKSNIINALRLVLTQLDRKLVKELPSHQHIWFFGYDEEPARIEIDMRLDKGEVEKIKDEIKKESGIEDVKGIKLLVEISKENGRIKWKLSEMKLLGHVSPRTIEITNETIEVAKKIIGGATSTKESSFSGIDVVKSCKIKNSKIFESLINILSYASGKIRYVYPAQTIQTTQPWDGRSEPGIPSDLQENIKQLLSGYERHVFMEYLGEVKSESYYIGGEIEPTKYYQGEKLPLWLFGCGDQSFDGIVAAIQLHARRYEGGILLLETPEMNLHPEFVRELAVFIEEITERNTIQIFVVTQSPEFIDALVDKSNIILVKQDLVGETPLGTKSATKVISLKTKDVSLIESLITELGSARVLFSNVVFLVEGGDDACLLKYWINSNRRRLRHLRRYSVYMVPYSRRIGIKGVARTFKSLGIKFFAFLDGDNHGKEDYNTLVEEGFAQHACRWDVADILGFVDGEKLVQAIVNVIKKFGIREDELESKLKETNAYGRYQASIKKIKNSSLKNEDGKEAFENIISIIFDNFDRIKDRYYEKWIFRDRFKYTLGSELVKFKLETPKEVISFLARIDEMLRPQR
ncbi:MAG: ATP-dependent nuclease [Candidatus Njordarchaeales archaeon]